MQRIAIIGSGPTGIYTAQTLLSQGKALAITLFESQAQAGKGTPYHQDWNDGQMLANIASIEIPPVNQPLVDWLQGCDDEALARMGIAREHIHDRAFFPRVALGEYFHRQLSDLIQKAVQKSCEIDVKTRQKVLDVQVANGGVQLSIEQHDGHRYDAFFDYVVMATGHVWPRETEIRPGYFLSPWPAAALRTIGHGHVSIRGTSLSAIDALVALSVVRGTFRRDALGVLQYLPEPGTETFHATLMSRKGLLPEADFYHPIPYDPLQLCTWQAMEALIDSGKREHLLDDVFALFKAELTLCDPDYAAKLGLEDLTLEAFSQAYFREREQSDPFQWAKTNLAEAKRHHEQRYTVAWRYAILRMHEVIAHIVPHLLAQDHARFNRYFRPIFVDDYATVPHESIERLLALRRAGKLDIVRIGDDYTLDTQTPASGAILTYGNQSIHFPFFIDAMGQRTLSVRDFPFPSLWKQGLLHKATAARFWHSTHMQASIGGIALDKTYHPVSDSPYACRLYCLSLPFMLGQFPFAQGITSSYEMGKTVAQDIIRRCAVL